MQAAELFALPPSLQAFADFFRAEAAPWEWVKQIGPALKAQRFEPARPKVPVGVHVEGLVHLDPTVKLPPYATIIGPVWIGPRTEIRPGAFIRGNVIVGADGVLGNACEFKNCLLLDRVQVPHFSYVGDSILGNGAHLGAGVICSNLRLDQHEVEVRLPAGSAKSGLRKLGALIGDEAEVGCNAVLQPGAVLGRRALVMPLTSFSGYLAPATMAGTRQTAVRVPRRD
ncbi:MAG: UDP-N-acetylglucosamine diphosphorylase [Opitutaceae bacterium]|nr:UDP-N-acetylglucosamine diphosphorylase [Opitutaceae bacterium]